jgi:hypothetical protein
MSQAFAGAFLSLASWWMTQPSPAPPAEMDNLFYNMVWSGVLLQTTAQDKLAKPL